VEEEEVELEDIKFEVVTEFNEKMFDADAALYSLKKGISLSKSFPL
jgi:hypothetical protein